MPCPLISQDGPHWRCAALTHSGAGQIAWGLDVFASLSHFFYSLLLINLGLALFNLIPAFPMDGGRILRAGLALRMDWISATRWAVKVGRWIAVLMGIAALVLHWPMVILIAVFIFFAGRHEEQAAIRRYFYTPQEEGEGFAGNGLNPRGRFTFRIYRSGDFIRGRF